MKRHVFMLAAVAALVFAATPAMAYTAWHNSENPPVTTGNIWSDDANWTNGYPVAGESFRIEQYGSDAAGTGTIIMDVDYSGGPVGTAEFFGAETVSMQENFKANALKFVNGGNGPAGCTILVGPAGTVEGDLRFESSASRPSPTINFTGGDWLSGDFLYERNEQNSIFKVSDAAGALTPGAIKVSDDPWQETNPNRWPKMEFVLGSAGVASVDLQDADPLLFTGDAAGTNPFQLTVDTTAYTGSASSIPLFTHAADTDRMFAAANITINQTTPGEWWVTQSDTGVTLEREVAGPEGEVPEPATMALVGLGAGALALRRRRRA